MTELEMVDNIKMFISYSHEDKVAVGKLKTSLEKFGFEVFVAHDDICPSKAWQDEILRQLNMCDIFLPYLTKAFRTSYFTDQESGIALAKDKYIIPLQVDLPPYGFVNKYQGLKLTRDNEKDALEILRAMINSGRIKNLRGHIIKRFMDSRNFKEAGENASMLLLIDEFANNEIQAICQAIIQNDQIHSSYSAKEIFIRNFIRKYSHKINQHWLKTIKELTGR